MKTYIYSLAFATTILSAISCSDNEIIDNPIPDSQKEMISFSLSDGASQTRAGFTGADTKIVMRIQSNDRTDASNVKYTRTCALAEKDNTNEANSYSQVTFSFDSNNYTRYWDDAHGRKSLLSVYAIAVPDKKDDSVLPTNTLASGDASDENMIWGTNNANTLTWTVNQAQTSDNIANNDLVYSNNIKENGKNGIYRWDFSKGNWKYINNGGSNHDDGQMLFYQNGVATNVAPTEAPGHFDRGHMVFNHALSRITVTLVEGTGFDTRSSTDFQFASGTNIKLLNVPYSGTFNVATGQWNTGATTGTINTIAKTTSTSSDATGTYMAQILPGYTFTSGNSINVMELTIDNNTYYITQDLLFKALNDKAGTGEGKNGLDPNASSYKMEQGKNYNFSITINKKGIEEITATLLKWSDITAGESSINNGHITISTYDASSAGTPCSDLHLYRNAQVLDNIVTNDSYTADQYQANYKEGTAYHCQPTQTSADPNVWKTTWYFEDNKTAYHIRSINSNAYGTGGNNVKNPTTGDIYTFFEMQNGPQSANDYHWGAPMNNPTDNKFKYDEAYGYKSHLYKGITAINDGQTINITELHMMSNINVVLKTSTGSDAVALRTGTSVSDYQYAKVELTRLYNKAQVDMGIGLVTPSNVVNNEEMTQPTTYFVQENSADKISETKPFTWAVVPQPLWRGSIESEKTEDYYVGITITTPDNNQYYIIKNLSEITASSVGTSGNQTQNEIIKRWYPNHSYTYTITITKKGIEAITCTLVNWSEVIAADKDIDLES